MKNEVDDIRNKIITYEKYAQINEIIVFAIIMTSVRILERWKENVTKPSEEQ